MAETTRLELATSGVTGQRSNRLSYASELARVTGIEPALTGRQPVPFPDGYTRIKCFLEYRPDR